MVEHAERFYLVTEEFRLDFSLNRFEIDDFDGDRSFGGEIGALVHNRREPLADLLAGVVYEILDLLVLTLGFHVPLLYSLTQHIRNQMAY